MEKMMQQMKKAFGVVADARAAYEAETDALIARHKELEAERDRIRRAPIPKSDLLPVLEGTVREARETYLAELGKQLQWLGSNDMGGEPRVDAKGIQALDVFAADSMSAFENHYGEKTAPYRMSKILLALLGDQIVAALRSAPYFEEEGLPIAERSRRIASLDKQMREIMDKLTDLEKQANAAGLDV